MEKKPNITREEVQTMIDEAVEQKVQQLLQKFLPVSSELEDSCTLEEVLASTDLHRWIQPPGSPSVVDLIREDRDNDEPYR
jgi:predicted naringenin-chalcone synthase